MAEEKVNAGKRQHSVWVWAIPAVLIALAGIVAFGLLRPREAPAPQKGIGDPVPASIMEAVAQVPPETWTKAGSKDVRSLQAVPPTSAGAADKPIVLYVGAEFCPYCASQRWALVAALSRFGTFSGLTLSASSSTDSYPNTSTFSFHGSSFASEYVEFQSVELQGREEQGGKYPSLQTPTPDQLVLYRKYNAPPYTQSAGSIPFVLIGQRLMWAGTSVPPVVLEKKDWETVAAGLKNGETQEARYIIANANMLTAAICAQNGGRPADVCQNPGVLEAAKLLPTPAPGG